MSSREGSVMKKLTLTKNNLSVVLCSLLIGLLLSQNACGDSWHFVSANDLHLGDLVIAKHWVDHPNGIGGEIYKNSSGFYVVLDENGNSMTTAAASSASLPASTPQVESRLGNGRKR